MLHGGRGLGCTLTLKARREFARQKAGRVGGLREALAGITVAESGHKGGRRNRAEGTWQPGGGGAG